MSGMSIKQIADAKGDREAWLEARKGYLTSSDFYTWLGDTPPWWSDTRHDVLENKLSGKGKEFDWETSVSVAHGHADEEHILSKFASDVGAEVEAVNSLTTNERWPGLAASIDGFVHSIDPEAGKFELCQDKEGARATALRMAEVIGSGKLLCEIKKSVSAGWSQGKVSEWYIPQIQGQMHILDIEYCVIVADTVYRKGRRSYWNLVPLLVQRDPSFASVMDRLNDEWLDAIGKGC